MLIRFSSIATGPITMFGDDAQQLIKMLGASGAIPGAISAEDIPAALQKLRQELELHSALNARSGSKEEGDDSDHDPPIMLASRAAPLIEILERAANDKAPVMWDKA